MPPQSRYRARPRDRRQAMRSLTSLHESRVYSPENFWSPVQKDFCNNIGTTRTSGDVRLKSAKRSTADIDHAAIHLSQLGGGEVRKIADWQRPECGTSTLDDGAPTRSRGLAGQSHGDSHNPPGFDASSIPLLGNVTRC